jgi:hypothetical protein
MTMTHDDCTCGAATAPTLPDYWVIDHVTHPALHALLCAVDKIPVSVPAYESTGHRIPAAWMPLCNIAEPALAELTIAEIDVFATADPQDDPFFELMNRTPSTMVAALVACAYQADWEMPHD